MKFLNTFWFVVLKAQTEQPFAEHSNISKSSVFTEMNSRTASSHHEELRIVKVQLEGGDWAAGQVVSLSWGETTPNLWEETHISLWTMEISPSIATVYVCATLWKLNTCSKTIPPWAKDVTRHWVSLHLLVFSFKASSLHCTAQNCKQHLWGNLQNVWKCFCGFSVSLHESQPHLCCLEFERV